jgi:TRAP-type uncharacterized transport system substrate-binding protein
VTGVARNRWHRVIGLAKAPSAGLKTALLFAVLAVIVLVAVRFDRTPGLGHVNVAFLSGSANGNYYAIVSRLAGEARRKGGRVDNLTSAGSIENIARLAEGKASCTVHFALVQDGLDWPGDHPFELIGRLSTPESFVLLGRDADRLTALADLRGMRIGIGPAGSGTAHVAQQVLMPLRELDLKVSNHALNEQLAMLQRGELDLGAFVIEQEAELLADAVRTRNLQIVDIVGAEALARRLPFARAGRIPAGHYDPVRMLPATDKRVVQIDTLIIGNGCASESATQGIITALTRQFPDFVRVNRERANLTGLTLASAARSYYESDGPDVVGEHVPWFIDIMPTARWLQLIFAFSLLFNAMAVWHRYRLWRLDAKRVKIESEIPRLFGSGVTVGDIATMTPDERHLTPEACTRIDEVVEALGQLAERCRKQSLSVLVPMGQEMGYRYQESLIADLMHALRTYRTRCTDPSHPPDSTR